MLSISPIAASAGGAASYYLSEEKHLDLPDTSLEKAPSSGEGKDNYYLKEQSQQPNTQWFGQLAEEAGMLGKPVEERQLTEVLAGRLNQHRLKTRNEHARNGFDFTFSAPKSVSLLALVGGDQRLMIAHDEAVKFALSHIEQDAAQARQTDPKTHAISFENTGNLLFAMVRHKTSREDDPQLHTHSLTANMTRDSEGTLRALASSFKQQGGIINGTGERVYHHQKYYTSLYQSTYARAVENMGYQTRSIGNNLFEIEGIPQRLLDTFSTRSQQIKQQTEAMGLDSQAAKDVAAKDTRKSKAYTAEATLFEQWQHKVNDSGFDLSRFVADSMEKNTTVQHVTLKPAAIEAVSRAVAHASNTQNCFNYAKLVESATLDFTRGDKLDALDIKLALDNQIEQGGLIPLDKAGATFTTKAQIDAEIQLLERIKGKTAHMRQLVDKSSLQGKGLNLDNQKKVTALFASTKHINLVNVFGSSKQLATALLHVGEASGKRIHIITPDVKSQQHSKAAVCRDGSTVVKWIKNQFKPEHTHTLSHFVKPGEHRLSNRDILVVEKANKLGIDELSALFNQAKAGNSKVILLNHAQARQGMKAGNAIEVLKKGNVNVSNWVSTTRSDTALSLYERSDSERIAAITQTYVNSEHKDTTQVVASTHKEVKHLNRAIRAQLQTTGELSRLGLNIATLNPVYLSDEQREVVGQYTKGMVLTQWTKMNGRNQQQAFTISQVNRQDNRLCVIDKAGASSTFNPRSRTFKAANFAIAAPDTLHIAKGDHLRMATHHHDSGLQKQRFTVLALSRESATLKDDAGKHHTVNTAALNHAPLTHAYATTPGNVNPCATHHLINIKAYRVSKEWLFDTLTQGLKQITVFTDKAQHFDDRLAKSDIKPSSIQRVMHAAQTQEKFVNNQTYALLTQDVSAALSTIDTQHSDKGLVHDAVNFAINHISEKHAGFSQKMLITTAIQYAFEARHSSITKEEIDNTLAQMTLKESGTGGHPLQSPRGTPPLLSAEYHDGTRWTTQAAIDTETRILARFTAGKGQLQPLVTLEFATLSLSQNARLTVGQKDAALLITTTPDRFVAVQGLAGTGKSTLLETGITLVKHSEMLVNGSSGNEKDSEQKASAAAGKNTQFIGLASTHAAVNELKDKHVQSQTVQSLLSHFLSRDVKPDQYAHTVFLLDESSMTSNAQMDKFTCLIAATGARAVFLGDTHQLTSTEAGKPFELAMNKGAIDRVTMTDIVRQQNNNLLGAVHNIVDRQGESAVEKIQQQLPFTDYQLNDPEQAIRKPGQQDNAEQQTPEAKQPLSHNLTQNLISTYVSVTKDNKKNQQLATEALPATVALEYLCRTPKARANTLIIAYTNKERDDIAHEIRQGLQAQGALSKDEITVPRLRGVHASQAALATMLPYQQGLILTTSKDNYFEISHVDKRHNMLTLANMHTGEEKHFFPTHHGHKFTSLWAKTDQPLAAGDTIMLRKSDRSREMAGNKTYRVSAINNQQMTLTASDNHTLTLSTTQLKDAHWDYAYTRTADMAQGATYENVITAIRGTAKLTNVRRAYIDITRASKHVKIITDNPQRMMLSWVNNDPNQISAIETRDKHTPAHTAIFNDTPLPQDNPKYLDINGNLDLKRLAADLNTTLPAYSESLATHLLGESDLNQPDKHSIAFNDGNLTLTTTGHYRGYFKDGQTGDKGSLLNLIMVTEKCNFKTALIKADKMLANPEYYHLKENPDHQQRQNTLSIKQSQLEARANQYFHEAKPLNNTLAQAYLHQQGITINQHDNLRFHPAVFSSETRKTYPALIANITNEKDETKAVEITYLDKDTGNKAQLKINKRILGSKSGNRTIIYLGNNTDYSIVAVGIENALSIHADNKNGADIIALNNNHDAKSCKTSTLRDNVIVVLDTTKETGKLAEEITHKLASDGKQATVIEPNTIPTGLNKTDTTRQLVNETVDNITVKARYLSSSINALCNDMMNNSHKHDQSMEKLEVNQYLRQSDEHDRHLAMNSQQNTIKGITSDKEPPECKLGEKTQ
ncbi:conjugative transfer relaxase/helicase TraI [Shewanella sp. YLB-07]|uniref:conjugative transfer relaxase/helicase TraI n=1 Tax=Shewanella sp. YLB-07 TaxID=2601268 RepID=UPI00128C601B|nr:conjugative transfer relaxase/helicase TraI [Shewanella sp. YLB-07]MPY24478.1 conjugative transfer relaxase/helicase TraI [Shewanella sp. YLB-07]